MRSGNNKRWGKKNSKTRTRSRKKNRRRKRNNKEGRNSKTRTRSKNNKRIRKRNNRRRTKRKRNERKRVKNSKNRRKRMIKNFMEEDLRVLRVFKMREGALEELERGGGINNFWSLDHSFYLKEHPDIENSQPNFMGGYISSKGTDYV